jgi:hypothetical protein
MDTREYLGARSVSTSYQFFWLANILVELFFAHKLMNIGYKNNYRVPSVALASQNVANYLKMKQSRGHDKKLVEYALVVIQTHPKAQYDSSCRG